ncbi:MAG TPA: SDR family oxidoreductase [Abditibacteriaceae bacterium]|jgi:NAD(P)-dependent dehydrogenase (short-subunit alcohol dehydrogenase family)
MTISLRGETVVVTGAAVRVGKSIALACARVGADVGISYNSSEAEARATVEELRACGVRAEMFRLDVSDATQIENFTAEVRSKLGEPTALINSAAIFRRTPWEALSLDDFDSHIAANLRGPFWLCKTFGDIFLQNGRGHIVNIADIHGQKPLKNYGPYCISKAGVISLTEWLAKTLAPAVRVNCICPGTILLPSETQGGDFGDDEQTLAARVPLGRIGSAEEIADTVVFLLGGPQFISGAVLPVDGAEHLR